MMSPEPMRDPALLRHPPVRSARLRSSSRVAAGALVFALTTLASVARAETPSKEARAAAVVLFDEGRALMAAGKHSEACPKLAESQRLDPGIGTLFNLSDCYERIGKTATAWIGFRDVAAAASAAGQRDREKVARARAAALEPKLSRLRLMISSDAAVPGLELRRDGLLVGQALWGTAVPVDPGEHVIVATAPGKKSWEEKIVIEKPGVVSVSVPPLEPEPPPASSRAQEAPASASPRATRSAPLPVAPAKDEPPRTSGGSLRVPLGVAALGLGAVGMGVGTALGFMARSTFGEANADGHCDDAGRCDDVGLGLRDDAVLQGNIGTGVFIAGAVLAAGGVILWITAPSSPEHAATTSARPAARVGVGVGSLRLEGTF